jgi:RHS repeat-associated protein
MYGYWQSKVLVQNDYTYATTGNRLTNALSDWTGPLRTEQYGYDELSRLISVDYGDGQTQGYTFDPLGNRLSKTDNVTGNETYGYNAANMLTVRNGSAYTNDTNGNTLTGGGRTNTWDGQNRLTQCVYNGTTTTHTYGADGLRRRTVQGANTTDYVLEGTSTVRTLLNSTVDRTYLHGMRGPEYERVGSGNPSWYLYDGLGSVVGIVDQNGNVVSTRKYDVYGAVRSLTGSSGSKHKWVGALGHPSDDETGLVYIRARYMDPAIGRFVTEDSARDGVNWFAYVTNNPTNLIDRDGHRAETKDESFFLNGLEGTAFALIMSGLALVMTAIGQQLVAGMLYLVGLGAAGTAGMSNPLIGAILEMGVHQFMTVAVLSNASLGLKGISSIVGGYLLKTWVENKRNEIAME